MYSIYADDELVYSPYLAEDGYVVLSPKLTLELNKAGSLTFVIPPSSVMYSKLNKLKTTITVKQDDEEIFRGRILNDEKDFYNRKDTYCEGELSFLVDSVVRPYSFSGGVKELFTKYVSNHNSQVEPDRQFKVGEVTVTDPNDYVTRASNNYPNSMDEMMDKLVDLLGGYLRPRLESRERYLDYVTDYGGKSDQVIEFGVNLLDITEYINAEDVFTVLIPLGAQQDGVESGEGVSNRLTIASVNDGKDYIEDETAISLFGRITKTNTWDDITLPSNLLSSGKEFLKSGIEMAVSLTVRAVDLHMLNVDTNKIKLGQSVRVLSLPHGLDKYFLCSKISIDMVNPNNTEYTFGVSFSSLTDKQVNASKHTNNNVVAIQTAVASANNAANKASESANKANESASKAESVVAEIQGDYVSNSTFSEYKNTTNDDILSIKVDYLRKEDATEEYANINSLKLLEERVSKLEGVSNE